VPTWFDSTGLALPFSRGVRLRASCRLAGLIGGQVGRQPCLAGLLGGQVGRQPRLARLLGSICSMGGSIGLAGRHQEAF
jgi:hypothetical protein